MPKGFIPLADREEVLGSHKAFALSYRNAKAKLVKAVEPVTPNGIILDTESLEKLREDVKAWSAKRVWVEQATMQVNQLAANRKRFQSTAPEQPLGVLPREALLAMADLDKQIGLLEQERGLLTQPRLTQQEIDADRKRAKVYKLVQKYREVAAHEVDCPNCGHDFVPNCDGQLEDLSLQLNKLLDSHTCGQLLNGNQEAEKGQYSEATLIAEEMRQPNVARSAAVEAQLLELYKGFASDYKHQLARLDNFEREMATHESNAKQLVQIGEQIAALGDLTFDYTYCGQLEATLKHQDSLVASHAAYEANLAHFKEIVAKNAILEAHIHKLEGCEEDLQRIEGFIKLSEQYDYIHANYELELARFNKRAEKITELELKVEDHKLAIAGLKETKKRIKSFLLPSLNKAASALVTVMTKGVIRSIQMLDDFSVKADGKRVDLFSGSEQAVINIALRIALGQVLTHKVFSVVIGDELDASMDVNRTGLLWQALANLVKSGSVEQVVLVSHEEEPVEIENLKHINFT
jgi:hypothetical protein